MIDRDRLALLVEQAKNCDTAGIEGAVVEVGVYEGGSLARIAGAMPTRKIYGIDTFEGMPAPCGYDLHKEGDFNDVNFPKIKKWFGINAPNVTLIKGLFPDMANKLPDGKFCFAHIDCDIYTSVKNCCEYFYPRMAKGGIMIFDDYGFPTTPGAKIAVDEYFADKTCEKRALDTKQCFVRVR